MKYKVILIVCMVLVTSNIANAFSNSLDGGAGVNNGVNNGVNYGVNNDKNSLWNNNHSSNTFQNSSGQTYIPKEHSGFEHQDRNFPNPTMNGSRYNSTCQFGTCIPGGFNP